MAKKVHRFDAKRKPAKKGKPPAKKKTKAPKKKGPRSQALPGMEQVRSTRLDNLCESIGDERASMNKAKQEETGLIQAALQEMQRKGITVYRHAKIELARVPGAEKLRVRVTKEEGDAGSSDLDTGDEPSMGDDVDTTDEQAESAAGEE